MHIYLSPTFDSDINDCDGAENCEFTHCIWNYDGLQSHVSVKQSGVLGRLSMKLVKALLSLSELHITCKSPTLQIKVKILTIALAKKN